MLTIVINVSFNNASGVIGGVAALLIITLSIPPDNTFTYVIARVFETFCGVFIADVYKRQEFTPNEEGKGFEFENAIVGGVVPREFIPAVEKGLEESMANGCLLYTSRCV